MGRAGLTARVTGWWHGLSSAAKYRWYTRLTFDSMAVFFGGFAMLSIAGTGQRVAAGFIIVATLAVAESRPELTGAADGRWAVRIRIVAAAVLVGLWVLAAVAVRWDGAPAEQWDDDPWRTVGVFVYLFAAWMYLPFVRRTWNLLGAAALATVIVFFADPFSPPALGLLLLLTGCGVFLVGTTQLTLWTLRVVDDLDRARATESALRVAEERLRFSRDLHDVVGRAFSTIAVKSELASRLSRAGDDRAAAEMDEVHDLAVASMGEMRAVVRGYRDIDLAGEVAGARSLLAAVGCRLDVIGDAALVPTRFHEVVAWVVREGTTNIVRHAAASSATLTLRGDGVTLCNDGAGEPGERSGLRGLAERLAEVGAELRVNRAAGVFTLDVHWEDR